MNYKKILIQLIKSDFETARLLLTKIRKSYYKSNPVVLNCLQCDGEFYLSTAVMMRGKNAFTRKKFCTNACRLKNFRKLNPGYYNKT